MIVNTRRRLGVSVIIRAEAGWRLWMRKWGQGGQEKGGVAALYGVVLRSK
jgi:hypothetical protein